MIRMGTSMAAACVAAALMSPLPAMAKTSISSHRAIYDLTLKRKSPSSTLTGVRGRMVFELAGAVCDGWTVNFRMVNEYQSAETPARVIDSRSSSFEAGDGLTMRYNQSEFTDNALQSEKQLSAERKADGTGGNGKIRLPEALEFTLPAGTVFSMTHQMRIMLAAEEGKTRDESVVFDGGDNGNAYNTITFIGARKPAGSLVPTLGTGDAVKLKQQDAWPMTISYFSLGKEAATSENPDTPSYQVSFEMYGNGVADRLVLDYGDFALDGKLANFEFLDQPKCE